jgi:hypothetical protein
VTFDEAERASDIFVQSYHHAAPFRADAFLDIWSSCRDAGATEESCREQAKRRLRTYAPTDDRSLTLGLTDTPFREMVRECLAGRHIGRGCQKGSKSAQILVEEGRLPE